MSSTSTALSAPSSPISKAALVIAFPQKGSSLPMGAPPKAGGLASDAPASTLASSDLAGSMETTVRHAALLAT